MGGDLDIKMGSDLREGSKKIRNENKVFLKNSKVNEQKIVKHECWQ